jgi:hypothetical protein
LLVRRTVSGLLLDVHLREDDHVHLYCGLTRLVDAWRTSKGATLSANKAYTSQSCGARLFRTWSPGEGGLAEALDEYLANVVVGSAHVRSEGAVQAAWAGITTPWTPFDREAVFGYADTPSATSARSFASVRAPRDEIESLRKLEGWAPTPVDKVGAELDQIAVDPSGRLVLIELKHAGASAASIYYAPLQLLQYVHEWATGLETVRHDLRSLVEARKELGLSPSDMPEIGNELRPVVGFGPDLRSATVRAQFDQVRRIANRHLPYGASLIEDWAMEPGRGPIRIG